ncbi:MAG: cupin domain-containing protein [Bacteroidia bacterium]|nr:cupin domain-containing protein [Methylotenera sp.]
MAKNQPLPLLGGITPAQFLAEYWQKKPLLIKQAIANFAGLLSPEDLAGLACEDEVQARIVQQKGEKWSLKNGPFDDADFSQLPKKDWTLLVQSVNHYVPEATDLLKQFDFIPHARLDDLMVSYAPDGGGVGPHFDSYDVFLLQGQGKRLWRISEQTDLTLVDGAPLRILKNFDTSQEWLLEAGDMLYLPPQIAHWGIAVSTRNEEGDAEDCMTYSIGFRAPKNQELASEFLGFMQDKLAQEELKLTGMYQDADLALQNHPAEISEAMVKKVSENLQKIKWSDNYVAQFLGTYLSEPKADVIFDVNKKMTLRVFSEKVAKLGIALDLKSQMLFLNIGLNDNINIHFFMNGEGVIFENQSAEILKELADKRVINAKKIDDASLLQQLYDWYIAGYLSFDFI